ncbi:hypothetical protein BFP97_10865 [Roseivirga sp. 4D4]|nr:hypothetical protein BFP97_10865 [Roseivirga sp. 4D4]
MEFVEVLNDNQKEARYYYENNWLQLRIQAKSKNYIKEYNLLETDYSEDGPFHFILITTFADQSQFEAREKNFGELIEAKGALKLLNDTQPKDFRKTVFVKNEAKQLIH